MLIHVPSAPAPTRLLDILGDVRSQLCLQSKGGAMSSCSGCSTMQHYQAYSEAVEAAVLRQLRACKCRACSLQTVCHSRVQHQWLPSIDLKVLQTWLSALATSTLQAITAILAVIKRHSFKLHPCIHTTTLAVDCSRSQLAGSNRCLKSFKHHLSRSAQHRISHASTAHSVTSLSVQWPAAAAHHSAAPTAATISGQLRIFINKSQHYQSRFVCCKTLKP